MQQIYNIVNQVTAQALGRTDLVVTSANFVSVGNEILSSDKTKDAWFGTLMDMVGETTVDIRLYDGTGINVRRHPIDYGVALQKIAVKLMQATENTTWNSASAPASNPYEKTPFTVKQKLFNKVSVWDVDGTIPDVQERTAFTRPEAMAAFINAQMTAQENSINVQEQNMINLCRSSFIARKFKQGGMRAVNILAAYNATATDKLSFADSLKSTDYLRYMAMRITLVSKYLKDMSVAFSDGDIERHTPKDMQCLDINTEIAMRMAYYLQSDTYHKELVALPNYEEINTWQAYAQGYDFNTTSSISVTYDAGNGATETFTQGGIIGVLYDWEALGTTVRQRRTRSIYNPKDEYTNYFNKAEIGYFNDLSENGVVFYMADDSTSMAKEIPVLQAEVSNPELQADAADPAVQVGNKKK